MADQYGWRVIIPDSYTVNHRAYAEKSLKLQVAEFLVDHIWDGADGSRHPYCVEIVQEWRNLSPYSVETARLGETGQELTLRLHISSVPIIDYMLPRMVEPEPLYEKPIPKSFWERAKLAGKYVFGKYY